MSTVTGLVIEKYGEVEVQWKIYNFSRLSDEEDESYHSPAFYFAGASWYLLIYPNGKKMWNSDGHIAVAVMRKDSGPSISAKCLLKLAGDKTDCLTATVISGIGGKENVLPISRPDLLKRKSELAPDDVVTILCSLKHCDLQYPGASLCRRLENLSKNLKDIYINSHLTDVVLKVGDEKIPAHKVILDMRSPVFSAMFAHDMMENRTGEVAIEDIDVESLKCVLDFIYSGDVDQMSKANALDIYSAANKYGLKELKKLCSAFVLENLSVAWVCEVIKFVELHEDEDIGRIARKFFKENAAQVVETAQWKTFSKENHELAMDLVVTALKVDSEGNKSRTPWMMGCSTCNPGLHALLASPEEEGT